MTNVHEPPITQRLTFERLGAAEADGLAMLLGDPEITRHIIANGATPERRAASALLHEVSADRPAQRGLGDAGLWRLGPQGTR